MTQIPPKATINPTTAFQDVFCPRNKLMITIQSGKIEPIIAPKPLEIYFTPQVLKPLLSIKFNTLKTKIVLHCRLFGQGCFLIKKYSKYNNPPKS